MLNTKQFAKCLAKKKRNFYVIFVKIVENQIPIATCEFFFGLEHWVIIGCSQTNTYTINCHQCLVWCI